MDTSRAMAAIMALPQRLDKRRARPRRLVEHQDHQLLVEIAVADLERTRLAPVAGETKVVIKSASDGIGGRDRGMELDDAAAGMIDDAANQRLAHAFTAHRGTYIDAPQQTLVRLLGKRWRREAGDADQHAVDERSEHRLLREALGDVGGALAELLVVGRGERARMARERLKPERAERAGMLWTEPIEPHPGLLANQGLARWVARSASAPTGRPSWLRTRRRAPGVGRQHGLHHLDPGRLEGQGRRKDLGSHGSLVSWGRPGRSAAVGTNGRRRDDAPPATRAFVVARVDPEPWRRATPWR